jgi:hypothetical protein
VYVNHGEFDPSKTPTQEIGIFGPEPDPSVPLDILVSYAYDEGSTETLVEFAGDMSGKIILNHVAGPDACIMPGPDNDPRPIPLKIFHLRRESGLDDDSYLILVDGGKPDYGYLRISCRVKSIVDRQTYTERRIYFHNLRSKGIYNLDGNLPITDQDTSHGYLNFAGTSLKWNLSLSKSSSIGNIGFIGATNSGNAYRSEPEQLKAEGGVRELGATRDFAPEDLVEAHWESLTMQSWRDVLIVIVGTLVALGAAMIVEAVRPLVDQLVKAHEVRAPRLLASEHVPATDAGSIPGPAAETATTFPIQSPAAQPKQPEDATSPSQRPQTPPKS